MPHYDYIYIVSSFTGLHGYNKNYHKYQRRLENIQSQLTFLQNYRYRRDNHKSVYFVVSQCGGNKEIEQKTKDILREGASGEISCCYISRYNWGMLPGAFYDAWQQVKAKSITADYVIAICDDWIFNHWEDREALLKAGYSCVGHFSSMGFKDDNAEIYKDWCCRGYKYVDESLGDLHVDAFKVAAQADKRRWMDGGGYFFSFKALEEMDKVMPLFTRAPRSTDNPQDPKTLEHIFGEHGVFYGEVGFPTEMWARGFKFTAFTLHGYQTATNDWIDPAQICIEPVLPAVSGIVERFALDDMDIYGQLEGSVSFPGELGEARQALLRGHL